MTQTESKIGSFSKALTITALLCLGACAAFKSLPPGSIFSQAERDLIPWREKWAPGGKPAGGEDAKAAEDALEKFEYLEEEHLEKIDREKLSLRLGEAYLATGNHGKAFAEFRAHLENFPLTEYRSEIEKYIYQIAVYWDQTMGSFLGTGMFPDKNRALAALEYLAENAPRSPYADDSLRLIADIQFQNLDFTDAIASYERILQGYPESIWGDLAEFRIALAYLKRNKSPHSDRGALLRAEGRLREYLATRKEGAFRSQARAAYEEVLEKLAESQYGIGEFYFRIDQSAGARFHFRETVRKYPDSEYAFRASEKLSNLPSGQ